MKTPNPPEYQMMGLVIDPDGAMHKVYDLDYATISEAVGGNIQILPACNFGHGLTLYCNEEGKRLDLAHNPYATQIVGVNNLLAGDHIVGPLFICGAVNDEGEETQLPYVTGKTIVEFVLQHGGWCVPSGRERVLRPGEQYSTGFGQN